MSIMNLMTSVLELVEASHIVSPSLDLVPCNRYGPLSHFVFSYFYILVLQYTTLHIFLFVSLLLSSYFSMSMWYECFALIIRRNRKDRIKGIILIEKKNKKKIKRKKSNGSRRVRAAFSYYWPKNSTGLT